MVENSETMPENINFILLYNPQKHSYEDIVAEIIGPYLMNVELITENLRSHYEHQVTPDLGIFKIDKKTGRGISFYDFFKKEGVLFQEISEDIYLLEKLPIEEGKKISVEEFRERFKYILTKRKELR